MNSPVLNNENPDITRRRAAANELIEMIRFPILVRKMPSREPLCFLKIQVRECDADAVRGSTSPLHHDLSGAVSILDEDGRVGLKGTAT